MINIIVARNNNNSIGKDNKLLYHIKEDMKRFKQLTIGNTVIMGSKTYLSLPNIKPLKDRKNIVLTKHEKEFINIISKEHPFSKYDNLIVANDIQSIIDYYRNSLEELFVIGGGEVYKQFLPYANKIYLTQIDDNKNGDTYFNFNKEDFVCFKSIEKKINDNLIYTFEDYIRK